MHRRDFLGASLGAALAAAVPIKAAWADGGARVRPGDPGWPGESDWQELAKATQGRLLKGAAPDLGPDAAPYLRNPFYRGDAPNLVQNAGYVDAWRATPSAYVVAAETAADVAAAVRFADAHNLRLVVKGGGHSYLGTSSAPDSLMIWTRKMNAIEVHEAFAPKGSSAAPVPAISLGAGCVWLHAYQAAANAGRYVQGGGCTTVGVGGFLLGGGFGSFSKAYGLAAASLLEAEIITADGEIHIVSAAQEPDLFWALKGGGGGTFGVVTRFTLATHELPSQFGGLNLTVSAKSDEAFRRLLARVLDLYASALFNPHWGEQIRVGPGNKLQFAMVFQGLSKTEAADAFKPLTDFVATNGADYAVEQPLSSADISASWFWSAYVYRMFARDVVEFDNRPGASLNDFWWKGDGSQAGAFWDGYQSQWLSASLLAPEQRGSLADALFETSRIWRVELHLNKGLAGAPEAALAAARDTPVNPESISAFALAIMGSGRPDPPATPEDEAKARERAKRVADGMAKLKAVAPAPASYFNECDFFQKDWQRAFWGDNYPKLADIKRRYDLKGLFFVHNGVGSEGWSADGFKRAG